MTRSEQVDTRQLLLGVPGDANGTAPDQRLSERDRILAYWPRDLIVQIESGAVKAPPWRMLLDPTAWVDVPSFEVSAYVRLELAERRIWPRLDDLRKRFGRVSNHRGPDEVPDQVALF